MTERAAAERVKEVALIQALREVEVAQRKAEAAELMAPAKQIESIKVLDVRGWPGGNGGGDGQGGGGAAERVVGAVLSAGAALPLLKELLQFAGTDPEKAVKGILEKLPGLKDVLGVQKPGSA